MTSEAVDARSASSARGVDFADHAAPSERAGAIVVDDVADELMARHAAVAHVAACQFEIGAADSGDPHAHDTFARRGSGVGIVAAKNQLRRVSVEQQRAHRPIETKKPLGALRDRVHYLRIHCLKLFAVGISPMRTGPEQRVNEPQGNHAQEDREPQTDRRAGLGRIFFVFHKTPQTPSGGNRDLSKA